MELDRFLKPDSPGLALLPAGASAVADAVAALERAGAGKVAARVARGRKMQTAERLFDEVSAALQFPPYFGENWDALDECLADLGWLSADLCVLAVLDAGRVLDHAGAEARKVFREVLQRVAGAHGKPGRLFRVLLQCEPGDEARVRSHWGLAEAPAHR